MKNKKIICLTVVFSMVMTLIFTVSVQAGSGLDNFKKSRRYNNTFQDVSDKDWFATSVKDCYEYGLVSGKGADRLFCPDDNMTYAEVLAFACRIYNIYNGGNGTIEQKRGARWYDGYLSYAKKNGILNEKREYDKASVPNDCNDYCNLNYAACVFYNSLPKDAWKKIREVNYVPGATSGEYCTEYYDQIHALYEAGILSGDDQYGTCYADAPITRAQAVTIMDRIINPELRQSYELEFAVIDGVFRQVDNAESASIYFDDKTKSFKLILKSIIGVDILSGNYSFDADWINCTVTKNSLMGCAGSDIESILLRITATNTVVIDSFRPLRDAGNMRNNSIGNMPIWTSFQKDYDTVITDNTKKIIGAWYNNDVSANVSNYIIFYEDGTAEHWYMAKHLLVGLNGCGTYKLLDDFTIETNIYDYYDSTDSGYTQKYPSHIFRKFKYDEASDKMLVLEDSSIAGMTLDRQ